MTERLNHECKFDVLGDILETMRFRGSIFFQSNLASPWGMSLSKSKTPRFHIVMSGDCFVGTDDDAPVKVQEMEIIMLPNGGAHWIADKPDRKLIPSHRAAQACELGTPLFQEGEITNRLVCGLVNYDSRATHPILDGLPEIIHFSMLERMETVWPLVTLINNEIKTNQGAGNHITDRLTEVLFLKLLNQYVSDNQAATGFLSALNNPRVHLALKMIHQNISANWSLSELGNLVGMSRATLVRHFQDAIGVTPIAYINNWRMMKAYDAIKNSSGVLEEIASETGFASSQTLTKAFVKKYGMTPSQLRGK